MKLHFMIEFDEKMCRAQNARSNLKRSRSHLEVNVVQYEFHNYNLCFKDVQYGFHNYTSCLRYIFLTVNGNSMKLHFMVEFDVDVCCAQNACSYLKGQGDT